METLDRRLSRRELMKLAAVGVAGTSLAGIAGCQSPQPPAPTRSAAQGASTPVAQGASTPVQGGVLTYANLQDAILLDPNVAYQRHEGKSIYQMFDCLTFLDPSGKLHPWLATDWSGSSDAKTWTFKLREDVKFHDGTPFNAEAVKYNFDRMVDPATKSRNAISMMGPYDGSQVVDKYTIKVNFNRPYGPFPYLLAHVFGGMVSPTAAKAAGPANFGKNPVGSGPFKFKEWVLKDHITLERNPDYNWGHPAMKHKGPAYLDQIIVRPITDDPARVAALESGQVDIADNFPTADVARFKADPKYTVVANNVIGVPPQGHINTEKWPTDDLLVRQAILYGHNSEEICKLAWDGVCQPAYSFLSQSDRFFDPAVKQMYQHDKAKAESLLQQAGWKKGSDGIYAKDGKPLQILFILAPKDAPGAEVLQIQMAAIGIKMDIRQALAPGLDVMRQNGEGNIASEGGAYPDASGTARSFHTSNIQVSMNFNRYRGKEIDQLLEAGDAELDQSKRAKIYSDMQKKVLDLGLAAPLYENTMIFAMRSQVKGFALHGMAEYPIMYDVYIAK